jgi:glutamyl-Q tRNA(Asp) synthetase
MHYTGRFAPSPTGPLHFGSLVAALASWLDARAAGGRWLLRIEDLDVARVQPGAADEILRQLEALGLIWDGTIVYQSRRTERYRAALARLEAQGLTYWCGCSRREIADSSLGLAADGARIYPGTCRAGLAAGRPPRAMRVRTSGEPIRFIDRVQGEIVHSVEREVGDFVLYRADGVFAYQLAVVVDDAEQEVTDVVRGADLLDSSARQISLQRLLGVSAPRYLHVPAAVNAAGEKLSKQTGARTLDLARPEHEIARALAFLGQLLPGRLSAQELLEQARIQWNIARIPHQRVSRAADC